MLDLDFDIIRSKFGRLNQVQVDGFNALLFEARNRDMPPERFAYVLATAWHETGGKMRPNFESLNYSAEALRSKWPSRFSPAEAQRFGRTTAHPANQEAIANRVYADENRSERSKLGNGPESSGDGWRYRGRGYVQITGRANYRRLSPIVGVDLEAEPDLALEPRIASTIIFHGMQTGLFTGKALGDYIDSARRDYVGARWIVNKQDKAEKIAGEARHFHTALTQATA